MQVIFLSDILGASGKSLDERYLTKRRPHESWSKHNFPAERPPRKDFALWEEALRQVVPAGGIPDRLGRFLGPGHKQWDWRFDAAGQRLLHFHDSVMDIYTKPPQTMRGDRSNRWTRQLINQAPSPSGEICSIRKVSPSVVSILSVATPPQAKSLPTSFMDVLLEWNSTWMWDSLRLVGDDHWVEAAIRAGSLMAVTDGSYIKQQLPDLVGKRWYLNIFVREQPAVNIRECSQIRVVIL